MPPRIRAKVTTKLSTGGNFVPPIKKSETKIFDPMKTSTSQANRQIPEATEAREERVETSSPRPTAAIASSPERARKAR